MKYADCLVRYGGGGGGGERGADVLSRSFSWLTVIDKNDVMILRATNFWFSNQLVTLQLVSG